MRVHVKTVRVFRVILLAYAAALVAFEMVTRGYVPVYTLAVIGFMLSVVGFQTYVVRRQRRIDAIKNRPRADYASIAAMEREIYGETFEHDGAPKPVRTVSGPHGSPAASRACWHCGTPSSSRINGLCTGCYKMLKGYGIETRRPATCPQGHPGRRWVEGRGEACPTCDDARDERRSNLRWN